MLNTAMYVPGRARGSGTSPGRPHLHRDRSPTVDDSVGRQDRRYPRGASRGGRNARRTDGRRIILLQTRTEASGIVRGYKSFALIPGQHCPQRESPYNFGIRDKLSENLRFT